MSNEHTWSKIFNLYLCQVHNGHIKRLTDDDLKSVALEIIGVNVATTYITTPIEPRGSLAIKLPFLVLIVKNMKKFFSFEVQVLSLTIFISYIFRYIVVSFGQFLIIILLIYDIKICRVTLKFDWITFAFCYYYLVIFAFTILISKIFSVIVIMKIKILNFGGYIFPNRNYLIQRLCVFIFIHSDTRWQKLAEKISCVKLPKCD